MYKQPAIGDSINGFRLLSFVPGRDNKIVEVECVKGQHRRVTFVYQLKGQRCAECMNARYAQAAV